MTTDIQQTIADSIRERDHRAYIVAADEWISDEIETKLEAEGYVFACSPANPDGSRTLYFAREDVLRTGV